MKKLVIFFAAVSLLFVGCKVDMRDGYSTTSSINISATAVAVTSESGASYTPQWQAGDQIFVEYGGKTYVYYAKSSGGAVDFRPEGDSLPMDVSGPVIAWSNATDGLFSIGSDQTNAEFPMYAYSNSPTVRYMLVPLSFEPLASILSLTISHRSGVSISSVTLAPADEAGMTGNLSSTDMSVNPETGAVSSTASSRTSNEIMMDFDALDMETDRSFLFEIPNGTVISGGFSVTIVCSDGTSYTNKILRDGTIEFNNSYVEATTNLYPSISVYSYEDMLEFSTRCAAGEGEISVELEADIDMQNYAWTPVTGFTGAFNGYGHNVYNLNVAGDGVFSGFFGDAAGTIQNVNFGTKDGSTYDGSSKIELAYSGEETAYMGVVARTSGIVSDVKNFVTMSVPESVDCEVFVGGIAGGLLSGTLSGCSNYGEISNLMTPSSATLTGSIGGIVGKLDSEGLSAVSVNNCCNYASVISASSYTNVSIGGVVGIIESTAYVPTISGCTNEGEVYFNNNSKAATHNAGGILGYIPSPAPTGCAVTDCANSGLIHSNMGGISCLGGIIGSMYGTTIRNCTNSGAVSYDDKTTTSNNTRMGGIVGAVDSGNTITGCENTGTLSSSRLTENHIGGIAGYMNLGGTVSNCTNRGRITVVHEEEANNKYQAIGGILGYGLGSSSASGPSVVECDNYGEIWLDANTSSSIVASGGIIGLVNRTIVTDCVNEGTVYASNPPKDATAGGIAGDDYSGAGTVSGCVNRGPVTVATSPSTMCAGGIFGRQRQGSVTDSKNFGTVTCNSEYAGSIVGYNTKTVSTCVAAGTVNGVELTAENCEEYAVGTNTGTVEGISFGRDN